MDTTYGMVEWSALAAAALVGLAAGIAIARRRVAAANTALPGTKKPPYPDLARELRPFLALFERYGTSFSLAMFGLREMNLRDEGDRSGRDLATTIAWGVRENDRVLSQDRGAVALILPQTSLSDAAVLVSRLKKQLERELGTRVAAGLAEALDGDYEENLVRRTRQALDAARESPASVQIHDGLAPQPWDAEAPSPAT